MPDIEFTESSLRQGLAELGELAQSEYHQPLENIVSAAAESPEAAVARIGRLIGVSMKRPLAYEEVVDRPSTRTGAFRKWNLRDQAAVAGCAGTWQYRTLDFLRTDNASTGGRYFETVHAIALDAHHETGFFGYLATSARSYICGDKEIRKKVDENVMAARKAGINLSLNAPEVVVGGGGVALGSYLISVVPVLGFVGVPVIAGVVLLLYTIGVDAFCKWSQAPETNVAEAGE